MELPPSASATSPLPPPLHGLNKFLAENFKVIYTMATNDYTLACFLAFSFYIAFDIWRAIKKRAIWLPGNAFALSGVTVQIIVWCTSVNNIVNAQYEVKVIFLIMLHYVVVRARVAVCVFIAYLLPGMAAPSVRVFGVLAVTICAQIASELLVLYNQTYPGYIYENADFDKRCLKCNSNDVSYVDWDRIKASYSTEITSIVTKENQLVTWSKIADLIIVVCLVVLGLILCCVVLASKTIQSLLKQRISSISGESDFKFSNEKLKSISLITEEEQFQFSNEKTKMWNDFEDQVLRSWFVARVCRSDYVISRSVFSSAVWITVTVCLIVLLKPPFDGLMAYEMSPFYGFIVIGYVVISWRWLASQLYYSPKSSWRRHLCLEDFWTSRTIELIHMYDLKRERQQFQRTKSNKSSFNKLQSMTTKIFNVFKLYRLLYFVLILQMCVVILSKVCGIISGLTVGNIVNCCHRFVLYVCQKCTMKENKGESHESYTRILEILCMPREETSALLKANKMALNKAKGLMEKGKKEGISCEESNSIFRPYSLQWEEKGTQLLNDLKATTTPSVLRYFPSVEKDYLKMTIVSLMTILIEVHKAKSKHLTKLVKACHEVWDLLSFVDESDIDMHAANINLLDDINEEKDQVLLVADREFYKLQMQYHKLPSMGEDCLLEAKMVKEFLMRLSRECEKILRKENIIEGENSSRDLHDSRNWTKTAPSYTLNKLLKFMIDKGIENLVEWTEESLRNVIACSMSRLPEKIVKRCWILAQEFEEDKLWETIQLAGKCRGMMEEWGKDTKTVNAKQHKMLCQKFQMCILCCPREEQPIQREKPLSNIDQYKIYVNEPSN